MRRGWRALTEPVVNALMGALAHVFLGLISGREVAIGGDGMKTGVEVNVAFPCPRVLPCVQTDHCHVSLLTVRFFNFVSCFLMSAVHGFTQWR